MSSVLCTLLCDIKADASSYIFFFYLQTKVDKIDTVREAGEQWNRVNGMLREEWVTQSGVVAAAAGAGAVDGFNTTTDSNINKSYLLQVTS